MFHFINLFFYLVLQMTLEEAFDDFIKTADFKDKAKKNDAEGGKLRVYHKRYNEGTLRSGAIVELLLANGYEIKADKIVKPRAKS